VFVLSGCSTQRPRSISYSGYRYDTVRLPADDSLSHLAEGFDIPLPVLATINGQLEDSKLKRGDVIKIPFFEEVYPTIKGERSEGLFAFESREALSLTDSRARFGDLQIRRLFRGRRGMWPVLGGPVSSPFSVRSGRPHKGIDIRAPHGTPVFLALAGKVLESTIRSGYGKVVVVDHGSFRSRYAHLSRQFAHEGESLRQGDLIGEVGATGNASGPHLHFELLVRHVGGESDWLHINPLLLYSSLNYFVNSGV
jgi:murein DD-endopeptidase MepM/ murein hydrolase activator NlpD